jgi:translation initiation factor 3 subunit C
MIWSEELSASLDQAAGVVTFHTVELSRPQQVAQILAEKLSALVEQNEKALDQKLGNATGWNDRADGGKGDKRGEQTAERRGRGERNRGGLRGTLRRSTKDNAADNTPDLGGARGGRGARFAQGLGNQMSGTQRAR